MVEIENEKEKFRLNMEDEDSDDFEKTVDKFQKELDMQLEEKKKKENKNMNIETLLQDVADAEGASALSEHFERFYPKGHKSLLAAVRKKEEESVRRLVVEGKVSANTLDRDKLESVLHIACEEGAAGVVSVLLQNGAKVNVRDRRGMTSFHVACKRNFDVDSLQHLVRCGANHQLADNLGLYPLDYLDSEEDAQRLLKYVEEYHTENGDLDEYLQDLGVHLHFHEKKDVLVYVKSGQKIVVKIDVLTTASELAFLASKTLNLQSHSEHLRIIEQSAPNKCTLLFPFFSFSIYAHFFLKVQVVPDELNVIKRMKSWPPHSAFRFILLPKPGCPLEVTSAYKKLLWMA